MKYKTITEEQIKWLGLGEIDINLMLELKLMSEKQVYDLIRTLSDSPWYNQDYATNYFNTNFPSGTF